ncbi:MAG: DUF2130 domain-containing protein [Muribaculaceae bacterium]|nr:DUF2130 domain-containing protein [Muribaculaceae bacterium]
MKELKCPHCGSLFQVDREMFDSLAEQVRSVAFEEELSQRVGQLREQLLAEYKVQHIKDEREYSSRMVQRDKALAERDAEIALLKERMEAASRSGRAAMAEAVAHKDLEIAKLTEQIKGMKAGSEAEFESRMARRENEFVHQLSDKEKEIVTLRGRVETERKEAQAREAALKEQHSVLMRQKDEAIEYYKDMKARMSTKMIGESLEVHCLTSFRQAQSLGMFPDAYFDKDNDVRTGTKGDFIFRDYVDGREYISIMFEMKNEADTTATRHRNSDFLEKLDKDRRDKGCEYAVLVSMLERDSDLYNEGIVNMSHRYPRMYVIRPQMFMNIIALLSQAARKNAGEISALRAELEEARMQTVDVTNFEKRRDQFVLSFGKLVEAHARKHADAIGGIDKVIEALERQVEQLRKVKTLFETSEQKLLRANESVENDFTIKKLTHGNPTMRAKFRDAREAALRQCDDNNNDNNI